MKRTLGVTLFSAGVTAALAAVLVGAQSSAAPAGQADSAAKAPPNIVFVLTDDLSWNLVQYLPQVQRMQSQGMTFGDYVVTDSLCCPSRSSIFTGRFPHDTGVFTNMGTDGGFATFRNHGWESKTYANALVPLGYRTSFGGKYLNGYLPTGRHIPPGWTDRL